MSFTTIQPEMVAAAASNLQSFGSSVVAHNVAAAAGTTGVPPAATDEVSALTATQLSAHAATYQAVGAQATAVHELLPRSWPPVPAGMR